MNAVVFNCPLCGGPIKSEEKSGTLSRGKEIWYFCQNKECNTTLYQCYDKKKSCYADGIYLNDTNRSGTKNRIWGLYWGKALTAGQWKKVSDGESLGLEPSPQEDEQGSETNASPGFRTLLGYGQLMAGCGWFLVILAALVVVIALAGGGIGLFAGIASSVALVIAGISFVVSGQIISCFVSIERNTRESSALLKQLKK
jgi:hypothetical protein